MGLRKIYFPIVILRGFDVGTLLAFLGLGSFVAGVAVLNIRFASRRELSQAIVVDIDNTILSDVRRKIAVLKDFFNKDVGPTEIENNYLLEGILSKKELKKFTRRFQSSSYARLDEPLEDSARVLSKMSQKYEIIYLTGRLSRMRDATVSRLQALGFPLKANSRKQLIMSWRSSDITWQWKYRKLLHLAKRYKLILRIGDAPSDCRAYIEVGMPAVCILGYWSKEQLLLTFNRVPDDLIFVRSWDEVETQVAKIK